MTAKNTTTEQGVTETPETKPAAKKTATKRTTKKATPKKSTKKKTTKAKKATPKKAAKKTATKKSTPAKKATKKKTTTKKATPKKSSGPKDDARKVANASDFSTDQVRQLRFLSKQKKQVLMTDIKHGTGIGDGKYSSKYLKGLHELDANGLIKISVAPEDATERGHRFEITTKGRKALEKAEKAAKAK